MVVLDDMHLTTNVCVNALYLSLSCIKQDWTIMKGHFCFALGDNVRRLVYQEALQGIL